MKKDLHLRPRFEGTRDAISVPTMFDLAEIKAHFDDSLTSIEKQYLVYDSLIENGKTSEGDNILRSIFVFAEGILDFYLHEISKYCLYEMFVGNWNRSQKYSNLKVPILQVEDALNTPESKEWFFGFVNNFLSDKVLLSAEAMRDQLNLIGIPFQEVMCALFPNCKQQDAINNGKLMIQALFARRNKIVHQDDRSHESAEKDNISKDFVENSLQQIKSIVNTIHNLACELQAKSS